LAGAALDVLASVLLLAVSLLSCPPVPSSWVKISLSSGEKGESFSESTAALAGAALAGAALAGTALAGAAFAGVPFAGVPFAGVAFAEVAFAGVSFAGIPFAGVAFADVAFAGVSFVGVSVVGGTSGERLFFFEVEAGTLTRTFGMGDLL
jgi:uncharacterized protein YjbI with pentapeptide repeats